MEWWLAIIVPTINAILNYSIKVLIIILLYKLIPLVKKIEHFK